MITGLRILNIAIIAFAVLRQINVYRDGYLITMLISLGTLISVPLTTLAATRKAASSRLRRVARILNGLAIVLGAAGHAMQIGMGLGSPFNLVSLAMGISPSVFNFWAIGQLTRRDSELSKPLPPDTVAIAPPASSGSEVSEHDPSPSSPNVQRPRHTYVRRHWSGDLPLPVSYWVNGSLAVLLFWQMNAAVGTLTEALSVRMSAWIDLTLNVSYMVLVLWSLVGICRSAIKYPTQGGHRGWAAAALVIAGVGALSFAIMLSRNMFPQMQENTAIAIGRDPLGRVELRLTEDGSGLALTGALGAGSAQDVRRLLRASPQVRTLLLDSSGGWFKEAEDIAAQIRARKLDTYVEASCDSACTYLFLAGRNRVATPTAEFGFHSPYVAGLDQLQQVRATAQLIRFYREAGLSERFIENIKRTAAEEVWYPSHLELMENEVITRVSASGALARAVKQSRSKREYVLALRSQPLMAAIEHRFPGTLDRTVETVWQAREGGVSNRDIDSTARAALASILPKLLDLATDEQLETYQEQLVGLLTAAQAESEDACALLIASKPGIEEMLPVGLFQRQMLWATQVLEGRVEPRQPISPVHAAAAIGRAMEGVSREYSTVLEDMPAYADRPDLQCAATIAFYDSVLALPSDTRSAALRGLLQGKVK